MGSIEFKHQNIELLEERIRNIFDPKLTLTSQRLSVLTIFLKYLEGTLICSSTIFKTQITFFACFAVKSSRNTSTGLFPDSIL